MALNDLVVNISANTRDLGRDLRDGTKMQRKFGRDSERMNRRAGRLAGGNTIFGRTFEGGGGGAPRGFRNVATAAGAIGGAVLALKGIADSLRSISDEFIFMKPLERLIRIQSGQGAGLRLKGEVSGFRASLREKGLEMIGRGQFGQELDVIVGKAFAAIGGASLSQIEQAARGPGGKLSEQAMESRRRDLVDEREARINRARASFENRQRVTGAFLRGTTQEAQFKARLIQQQAGPPMKRAEIRAFMDDVIELLEADIQAAPQVKAAGRMQE